MEELKITLVKQNHYILQCVEDFWTYAMIKYDKN